MVFVVAGSPAWAVMLSPEVPLWLAGGVGRRGLGIGMAIRHRSTLIVSTSNAGQEGRGHAGCSWPRCSAWRWAAGLCGAAVAFGNSHHWTVRTELGLAFAPPSPCPRRRGDSRQLPSTLAKTRISRAPGVDQLDVVVDPAPEDVEALVQKSTR